MFELPNDEKWKFPIEKVSVLEKIGGGHFGVVHKAVADGIVRENVKTMVAVKMPHGRFHFNVLLLYNKFV